MITRPRNYRITKFGPSQTIPGQSLTPSDLLKRHLAGTLPPIDHSDRNEYHYDTEGNQVGEALPLEMHEMHALAVALRNRQFEEATERRKEEALKFRDRIIAEHEAQQKLKTQEPNLPASKLNPAAPEG